MNTITSDQKENIIASGFYPAQIDINGTFLEIDKHFSDSIGCPPCFWGR